MVALLTKSRSIEESGQKWQGFGFRDTAFSALGGGPSLSFPGTQTALPVLD